MYIYNVRRLQTNPHNSVVKHQEHLFIYTRCDVTSAEVASHNYNYNTMTWQCLVSLSLSAGSPTACSASFRSVKDRRYGLVVQSSFFSLLTLVCRTVHRRRSSLPCVTSPQNCQQQYIVFFLLHLSLSHLGSTPRPAVPPFCELLDNSGCLYTQRPRLRATQTRGKRGCGGERKEHTQKRVFIR